MSKTRDNYRTTYSFVCIENGQIREYNYGCNTGCVAAVMELWRGVKLVSRDQFVANECWVKLRPDDPDFDEKEEAIKKREAYRMSNN